MKGSFLLLFLLLCCKITPAGAQKKQLRVGVDERMEFLTIVQYLSDYPILNQNDSLTYKRTVERYFAPYKEHPAIQLHRKIYRRMLGFDAPVIYLYHFSFPDFHQVADFTSAELSDLGFTANKDTLELLRAAFRNFYRASNFDRFYQSQQPFYRQFVQPVAKALTTYPVVEVMERHYGQQAVSYRLVLTPLLHNGGYAVDVPGKAGHAFNAVVGPEEDSTPVAPRFSARLLLSEYVLHEFSHNFCNPWIDRYYDTLKNFDCLLTPIRSSMKKEGYGNWKACLYEHLVRANEIVLNEQVFGRATADSLYGDFIRNGWIYLEGLVPLIRNEYLPHRARYPTLEKMMPLIVGYFRAKAAQCEIKKDTGG